jgi:predicted XRE-type DNA-binding protein
VGINMALTKSQRKKKLRYGDQTEIARRLGVPDSLVSAVMNNKHQAYSREKVQLVRQAVAEKIGEPIEEVWGSAA